MVGLAVANRLLGIAGTPLGDDIGQFAAGDALAFVIERETIVFQVVEPGMLGLAATGEDVDGGGDSGVGLEDTTGRGVVALS